MKAHMIENPTHFKGDPVVTWRGLEEPFKMRLYVGWGYSFTGEQHYFFEDNVGMPVSVDDLLLTCICHQEAALGM